MPHDTGVPAMRVDLIYIGFLMPLVLGVCGDHSHDQEPVVTKTVPKHFRVCLERLLSFNITDIGDLQHQRLQELYKCFSRADGPCGSSPSPLPQPTQTPGVGAQPRVPMGIIMISMAAAIAMLVGILTTVCFFTCCKKRTRHREVDDNTQL